MIDDMREPWAEKPPTLTEKICTVVVVAAVFACCYLSTVFE